MKLVARSSRCTVRHEFGPHAPGRGVQRDLFEVDDAVEQCGRAYEFVESHALVVLLDVAMRSARAAERRCDRGADHAHTRHLCTKPGDDISHPCLDRLDRGIAVLAEVVDSFQPNDRRDARKANDIPLHAGLRGRPPGNGFCDEYVGGPAT